METSKKNYSRSEWKSLPIQERMKAMNAAYIDDSQEMAPVTNDSVTGDLAAVTTSENQSQTTDFTPEGNNLVEEVTLVPARRTSVVDIWRRREGNLSNPGGTDEASTTAKPVTDNFAGATPPATGKMQDALRVKVNQPSPISVMAPIPVTPNSVTPNRVSTMANTTPEATTTASSTVETTPAHVTPSQQLDSISSYNKKETINISAAVRVVTPQANTFDNHSNASTDLSIEPAKDERELLTPQRPGVVDEWAKKGLSDVSPTPLKPAFEGGPASNATAHQQQQQQQQKRVSVVDMWSRRGEPDYESSTSSGTPSTNSSSVGGDVLTGPASVISDTEEMEPPSLKRPQHHLPYNQNPSPQNENTAMAIASPDNEPRASQSTVNDNAVAHNSTSSLSPSNFSRPVGHSVVAFPLDDDEMPVIPRQPRTKKRLFPALGAQNNTKNSFSSIPAEERNSPKPNLVNQMGETTSVQQEAAQNNSSITRKSSIKDRWKKVVVNREVNNGDNKTHEPVDIKEKSDNCEKYQDESIASNSKIVGRQSPSQNKSNALSQPVDGFNNNSRDNLCVSPHHQVNSTIGISSNNKSEAVAEPASSSVRSAVNLPSPRRNSFPRQQLQYQISEPQDGIARSGEAEAIGTGFEKKKHTPLTRANSTSSVVERWTKNINATSSNISPNSTLHPKQYPKQKAMPQGVQQQNESGGTTEERKMHIPPTIRTSSGRVNARDRWSKRLSESSSSNDIKSTPSEAQQQQQDDDKMRGQVDSSSAKPPLPSYSSFIDNSKSLEQDNHDAPKGGVSCSENLVDFVDEKTRRKQIRYEPQAVPTNGSSEEIQAEKARKDFEISCSNMDDKYTEDGKVTPTSWEKTKISIKQPFGNKVSQWEGKFSQAKRTPERKYLPPIKKKISPLEEKLLLQAEKISMSENLEVPKKMSPLEEKLLFQAEKINQSERDLSPNNEAEDTELSQIYRKSSSLKKGVSPTADMNALVLDKSTLSTGKVSPFTEKQISATTENKAGIGHANVLNRWSKHLKEQPSAEQQPILRKDRPSVLDKWEKRNSDARADHDVSASSINVGGKKLTDRWKPLKDSSNITLNEPVVSPKSTDDTSKQVAQNQVHTDKVLFRNPSNASMEEKVSEEAVSVDKRNHDVSNDKSAQAFEESVSKSLFSDSDDGSIVASIDGDEPFGSVPRSAACETPNRLGASPLSSLERRDRANIGQGGKGVEASGMYEPGTAGCMLFGWNLAVQSESKYAVTVKNPEKSTIDQTFSSASLDSHLKRPDSKDDKSTVSSNSNSNLRRRVKETLAQKRKKMKDQRRKLNHGGNNDEMLLGPAAIASVPSNSSIMSLSSDLPPKSTENRKKQDPPSDASSRSFPFDEHRAPNGILRHGSNTAVRNGNSNERNANVNKMADPGTNSYTSFAFLSPLSNAQRQQRAVYDLPPRSTKTVPSCAQSESGMSVNSISSSTFSRHTSQSLGTPSRSSYSTLASRAERKLQGRRRRHLGNADVDQQGQAQGRHLRQNSYSDQRTAEMQLKRQGLATRYNTSARFATDSDIPANSSYYSENSFDSRSLESAGGSDPYSRKPRKSRPQQKRVPQLEISDAFQHALSENIKSLTDQVMEMRQQLATDINEGISAASESLLKYVGDDEHFSSANKTRRSRGRSRSRGRCDSNPDEKVSIEVAYVPDSSEEHDENKDLGGQVMAEDDKQVSGETDQLPIKPKDQGEMNLFNSNPPAGQSSHEDHGFFLDGAALPPNTFEI